MPSFRNTAPWGTLVAPTKGIGCISWIGKSPAAYQFAKNWQETTDLAKAFLVPSPPTAKRMKKWADTKRRPVRHVIDLYDDNRKHESLVAEGKAIKGRNPTESVITTKLE